MSNNQLPIRMNLLELFFDKPELRNKTSNTVVFEYLKKYHGLIFSENFINSLPSFESITRQKRKLAEIHKEFWPNDKKVIESRLNQTNEILESVRD